MFLLQKLVENMNTETAEKAEKCDLVLKYLKVGRVNSLKMISEKKEKYFFMLCEISSLGNS